MKTYFSKKSISIYSIVGLAVFAFSSCGSYRNSSYYDRDGIYNNADGQNREVQNSNNLSVNNQYKDYFGSLQNDKVEIFTDVENYDSTEQESSTGQGYDSGYAGWGNDSDNVTINVYGNNWGYNYWNYWYGPNLAWSSWYGGPYWSIGWNSWYGPGWGWNNYYAPYYGYGYYNSYYGNPWCNYGNHYVHHGGRRGANYNGGMRGENTTRNVPGRRTYTQPNSSGVRNNNSGIRSTRTRTFNQTGNGVRNQNPGTRNRNSSESENNNVRPSSTPTRTYSPNSNSGSGTRSSGTYNGGSGTRGSSSGGRR